LGLLFSFGTVNGSFNIYGSLLDNIMDCYDYTTDQVSYLAAVMMLAGIISAALFGLYIERTYKYHFLFRILAVLGLVVCVSFPLLVATIHVFPLTLLMTAVMGVVFIPFMPLSFDYGCDILFPAGEAQITGCLMASGNLVGVIFVQPPLSRS
jgi:MFS family permease